MSVAEKKSEISSNLLGLGIGVVALSLVAFVAAPVAVPVLTVAVGASSATAIGAGIVGLGIVGGGVGGWFLGPSIFNREENNYDPPPVENFSKTPLRGSEEYKKLLLRMSFRPPQTPAKGAITTTVQTPAKGAIPTPAKVVITTPAKGAIPTPAEGTSQPAFEIVSTKPVDEVAKNLYETDFRDITVKADNDLIIKILATKKVVLEILQALDSAHTYEKKGELHKKILSAINPIIDANIASKKSKDDDFLNLIRQPVISRVLSHFRNIPDANEEEIKEFYQEKINSNKEPVSDKIKKFYKGEISEIRRVVNSHCGPEDSNIAQILLAMKQTPSKIATTATSASPLSHMSQVVERGSRV